MAEHGAIVQNTGRADLIIRKGVTETFGTHWERSVDGGLTFQDVDLSTWEGVFVLRSSIDEVLLQLPTSQSVAGIAYVTIRPEDTDPISWNGQTSGNWYMNVTDPDGRVERLADGYFYLEG